MIRLLLPKRVEKNCTILNKRKEGTTFWNMRVVFSKVKRVEPELTDENKHLKKLNREKSKTHYQF